MSVYTKRAALLSGSAAVPAFTPLSLFAAGEQGGWYDPSDFSTLFQDSAGTTPVTAVEQPVGKVLDKSGRGNHLSQSTSTARPVLSARVNLLTYTEQFDNAAWTNSAVTVAANNAVAPDGTTTADKLTAAGADSYLRQAATVMAGINYTLSVALRADTPTTVNIYCLNPVTAQVCNVTTEWQRFSLTVAPAINGSVSWQIGGGNSFSTGEVIYAWGADLRVTNDGVGLPAYQRVGAATAGTSSAAGNADYDVTNFPYYLRWDGTDDGMSTASIDFTSTDKMSVISGVRKLSSVTGLIAEISANAESTNGAFRIATDAAGYEYLAGSRGTTFQQVLADNASYASPVTNVISMLATISGPSITFRANGAVVGTETASQGAGNYGNHILYVGRRNNATLPFNGHIYGLVIVGRALTAAEISNMETWLNSKTKAF